MSTWVDGEYGATSGARSARTYRAASTRSATRAGVSKRRADARTRAIGSANTHPRIGPSVCDVGEEIPEDHHQGADDHGGENEWIVPHEDRRRDHHPHPRPGEHAFDEHGAAEEGGEGESREGDHRE